MPNHLSGCTKTPLILSNEIAKHPRYFLEPNEVLAQAVVKWIKGKETC